jgi:zinc transport system ATP-binding protein
MKTKTLIIASNVSFIKNNKIILSNINLQIRGGEIVSIVGPSSSGKTTLLKLLMKLEKPNVGKIYKIKNLKVGYLPQKINLPKSLPLTVEGFLKLYKNKSFNIYLFNYLLKTLRVQKILKKQMSTISGEELQRVLLTSAIMNIPVLLVLDEPTSSMSIEGQNKIYNLIAHISRRFNMAVIMASHNLHTVMAKTNKIVYLNRHICYSGNATDILKYPEYKKLFGEVQTNDIAFYKHKNSHYHTLSEYDRKHKSNYATNQKY